jgi:holin-like protein
MKLLWQIGIILAVCFAGEGISLLLPFSFPASVITMIILFLLLTTKCIKSESLRESSSFMLNNMSLLFIPAGVGIMQLFDSIKDKILPLLAVCILSTIITFAATSFTVRFLVRLQDRLAQRKGEKS